MAIHPDIRDEAYQFFIQEATDLLQAIEMGLLALSHNRSTTTVHELMRAAHSLKGGAASVGLEAIATLAHRLESIFKVFYDESVDITPPLERSLLQAYDCLRLPLKQQIERGQFDDVEALAIAEPIFSQLENQFQEVLVEVENYVPTSGDLGVDMVASIFEIDVTQGLEHLIQVMKHPQDYDVAQELREKVEVFSEFSDLFNIKGLRIVAEATTRALDQYPHAGLAIIQLAIKDFEQVRRAILSGDRTPTVTLAPEWQTFIQSREVSAFKVFPEPQSTIDALSPHYAPESDKTLMDGALEGLEHTEELDQPDVVDDTLAALDAFFQDDDLVEVVIYDEDTPIEPASHDHEKDGFVETGIHENDEPSALSAATSHVSGVEGPIETNPFDDIDQFLMDLDELEQESLTLDQPSNSQTADPKTIALKTTEAKNIPSNEIAPKPIATTTVEVGHQTLDAEFEELDVDTQCDDYRLLLDLEQSLDHDEPMGEHPKSQIDVDPLGHYENNRNTEPPLVEVEEQESRVVPLYPTHVPHTLEMGVQTEALVHTERSPQQSHHESTPSSKQSASGVSKTPVKSRATIRVDTERLERMNNLVGELAINREGLALQNEQLQSGVQELLKRFSRFQSLVESLRDVSDQMLVAPERYGYKPSADSITSNPHQHGRLLAESSLTSLLSDVSFGAIAERFSSEFDALEMDQYGILHAKIQNILEDLVQLEEGVEDIKLFSQQSDQTINKQRYKLTHLRDELVWARMLPLGDILNRFPRLLHDLSATHNKSVNLRLTGMGVLVDRGVLEKLYDPLLHLIRNAFDHGIESAEIRRQRGKAEEGQIEIRAFHQGNQTIIEVTDDGQGINFEHIRKRLLALGWASIEQLQAMTSEHLLEILFVPGFSTARQVSQLSGRGVGLDVVRSQLQSIKGSITITSTPQKGTTFTLYLPLRLTIAKLIICLAGPVALAFPSDSIEEILTPLPTQVSQSANQRFLNWNNQIIPVHSLTHLLEYNCPLADNAVSKALVTVSTPKDWPSPMLVFRQERETFALEVNRLVNEQELVIKPFGQGITPPKYAYGSAILGDGSLVPVLDASALLRSRKAPSPNGEVQSTGYARTPNPSRLSLSSASPSEVILSQAFVYRTLQTPTILVVDDAVTIRRSLTLSLTRSGFRVLQARDGREALTQLQQSPSVSLIICDVEMPNMNGFEFLTHRRQDPQLSRIPTVMLTSRGNDKHRRLATRLGATSYFTKPYLEHDFLSAIQNFIDRPISQPASTTLNSSIEN